LINQTDQNVKEDNITISIGTKTTNKRTGRKSGGETIQLKTEAEKNNEKEDVENQHTTNSKDEIGQKNKKRYGDRCKQTRG